MRDFMILGLILIPVVGIFLFEIIVGVRKGIIYRGGIKQIHIMWRSKNKTPRFVKLGTAEQVQDSLRRGADPNAPDKIGRTPLMIAAACCSPEVITLLLRAGADVHHRTRKWNVAPLMVAAAGNPNYEVMATLLRAGADPNESDRYGDAPLVWWFRYASGTLFNEQTHLTIVSNLLRAGANPVAPGELCPYPSVISLLEKEAERRKRLTRQE